MIDSTDKEVFIFIFWKTYATELFGMTLKINETKGGEDNFSSTQGRNINYEYFTLDHNKYHIINSLIHTSPPNTCI